MSQIELNSIGGSRLVVEYLPAPAVYRVAIVTRADSWGDYFGQEQMGGLLEFVRGCQLVERSTRAELRRAQGFAAALVDGLLGRLVESLSNWLARGE